MPVAKIKKINVLQVIGSMFIGGAEKVVSELALYLDRNKYNVHVCCIKGKGILGEKLEADNIPVHILADNRSRKNYTSAFKLLKLIKQQNIDIIHSHGTIGFFDCAIASLLCRKPIYFHTFHYGNYPNLRKKYFLGEKLSAKLPDRLVAISNNQRDQLVRHYKIPSQNITVIHNGVERNKNVANKKLARQKRKELNVNDGDIIIGTVAVLSKQKGITYLLDTAKDVVKSAENVKFVIVGDGKLIDELKRKAKRLEIQDYIIFTGWRTDVQEMLLAFDIFVMTSLWEGLPMALLEAMAAGKAVVTSDVGDNACIIENGVSGYVVPREDPVSMSSSLLKIIAERSQITAMGEAALKCYEARFSVQKMVDSYSLLYEKYLSLKQKKSDKVLHVEYQGIK